MEGMTHLLLAIACLVGYFSANQAIEEAASENTNCYKQELSEYSDLFLDVFSIKLGENVDIYINCMSFGSSRELHTAIVSGRHNDTTEVLEFKCETNILLALESEREFSTSINTSCLDCADSTTGDACIAPCADKCERCYDAFDHCVRCGANLVFMYDEHDVERAVEELSEEELGEDDNEIEHTIEKTIIMHSSCASDCQDGFEVHEGDDTQICYACGVQFCIECSHGECEQCLPHTKLYHEEGECLFGFKAEVLEVFEEQEHEVEEEERERDESRLQLAVTLPIVSLAVIAFFVFMSFIAHKRYPHIGDTGKTRHRNKQDDPLEVDIAIDDSVFRPRPTVRLR